MKTPVEGTILPKGVVKQIFNEDKDQNAYGYLETWRCDTPLIEYIWITRRTLNDMMYSN